MPSKKRRHEALLQTLMVFGSILVCLFALELGLHLEHGPKGLLDWHNVVRYERVSIRGYSGGRTQYHPILGFVAPPNYATADLNFDAKGFRLAPAPAGMVLKEPPILAVGGSITLGDEVADDETYPAQLQRLIGRRVINAGMEGYGLDQMVLRAEIVAPQEKPAAIVLSFGAENLRRSEMSRVWGVEKPYFELVDGKLMLRNVPVPPSPDPATTLDIWQRLFGRSLLVDFVLRRLGWQYEWALDHFRVLPRGEGARQSCPLFKRLAELGPPVVVMAEYDPYLWTDPPYMREQRRLTDSVLRCATDAGFITVDPFDAIDKGMRTAGRELYFRAGKHPSPAGQKLIAEHIAKALERLQLP